MYYYKIVNNYPQTYSGDKQLEGFKEFTKEIGEDGLVTYLPKELNDAMIALEAQAISDAKIAEAQAYLAATDFKMTADYDEDVTAILPLRQEARDLIRLLQVV